jgi:hypothetical protein
LRDSVSTLALSFSTFNCQRKRVEGYRALCPLY